MSSKECGVRIICEDGSVMYDRRLCEKPVSYYLDRLEDTNRSLDEVKHDMAMLLTRLNIDLDVDELIDNALKKVKNHDQ